jgi:hypothetical protein
VQTIDLATSSTLVPPARLGTMLAQARAASHLSLPDLVARSQGHFSVGDLELLERGAVAVVDQDVEAAAALYGVDLSQSTRGHAELIIDRSEGKLAIGESTGRFAPNDDDRDVMIRYLSLVYRLRNSAPGQILPARNGDLEVLAQVFSSTPEQVRLALEDLMLHHAPALRETHSILRRRIAIPAIGVLVALTAVGGLVLMSRPEPAQPKPVVGQSVEIGTAMTIERTADGGTIVSVAP